MLKSWKIFDKKVELSIKILEKIYVKHHYNSGISSIISLFDKVMDKNHYYIKNGKKVSYVVSDLFNRVKGMV